MSVSEYYREEQVKVVHNRQLCNSCLQLARRRVISFFSATTGSHSRDKLHIKRFIYFTAMIYNGQQPTLPPVLPVMIEQVHGAMMLTAVAPDFPWLFALIENLYNQYVNFRAFSNIIVFHFISLVRWYYNKD